MIKIYPDGTSFYNENKDFLLTNKYTEVFFRFDAPLLKETNKEEYAIKVFDESHTLLILIKEPFNMLLYGDKELSGELVDYLIDNGYKIKDYLCPIELGESLLAYFKYRNYKYHLSIGMDFMEAHDRCDVSSLEVEVPSLDDVEEIYKLCCNFVKDCGLKDIVDKDKITERIKEYRVIRKDNKIIAMAKYRESTPTDISISHVYTRKEYRGKGYARQVVGTILNEIIDSGFTATLNVDQKNPISYHIYTSLGFKKIFSQGIFVK